MRVYKSNNIIEGYIFLCITIIGSIYIISGADGTNRLNLVVMLSFFINAIVILAQILKVSPLGYRINDMIWIYMLIFLVIAPIIQYITGKFPWWNSEFITDSILVYSNMMVLIFIITFLIIRKKIFINLDMEKKHYIEFKNVNLVLDLIFYFSCIASLYIISKVGFFDLFSRNTNSTGLSGAMSLIVTNAFNAFPIIGISMHMLYRKNYNRFYKKYQFIIILGLGVLVNFPTGIPRFKMAAIYIGIILIICSSFKNKYTFKYIIMIGLLFLFPLINVFRYNSFDSILSLDIMLPNPTEDFLKGDFDSYAMLARSVIYTQYEGLTYGRQLVGSILFFIPRFIWSNKPIGSGATIAEKFGWQFTNVSCPFIGEGYINFGVLGVIIFAIVFSFTVTNMEYKYEYMIVNEIKNFSIIRILYPYMLGFVFFILRGDLLSSLSYVIGFCVPCIGLLIIDRLISNLSKNRRRKKCYEDITD